MCEGNPVEIRIEMFRFAEIKRKRSIKVLKFHLFYAAISIKGKTGCNNRYKTRSNPRIKSRLFTANVENDKKKNL